MARRRGGPYICFCETNPFHFRLLFDGSGLFSGTCAVCRSVCKWVRSGKTNPFWGRFEAVFIEKWVRFGGTNPFCEVATVTSLPRSKGGTACSLFPTYARKHGKEVLRAVGGTSGEGGGVAGCAVSGFRRGLAGHCAVVRFVAVG